MRSFCEFLFSSTGSLEDFGVSAVFVNGIFPFFLDDFLLNFIEIDRHGEGLFFLLQ